MEQINLEGITYEEICILIEAVDAWKSRSMAGELMGGFMEAMFSDKISEEAKAKRKIEQEQQKKEKEIKNHQEETKATLLKAKLMILRDKIFNATINGES